MGKLRQRLARGKAASKKSFVHLIQLLSHCWWWLWLSGGLWCLTGPVPLIVWSPSCEDDNRIQQHAIISPPFIETTHLRRRFSDISLHYFSSFLSRANTKHAGKSLPDPSTRLHSHKPSLIRLLAAGPINRIKRLKISLFQIFLLTHSRTHKHYSPTDAQLSNRTVS